MNNFELNGQNLIAVNGKTARLVQCDKDGNLLVSIVNNGSEESKSNSIVSAVAKVPSDTAKFEVSKGIYVGDFGDIVVTVGGKDITMKNIATGVWHPISITAIKLTGTTASNILVGY